MEKIGKIELEGMEFKAYHGCLEQEKIRGNSFTVDFQGELDLSAAAASDNLNDTLNYADIYEIVAEEMSKCSRKDSDRNRKALPAADFVFSKGFKKKTAC